MVKKVDLIHLMLAHYAEDGDIFSLMLKRKYESEKKLSKRL